MPLRILWVSSVNPYPIQSGNHLRHYHLIRAAALMHHVTLICPEPPTSPEDLPHLRSLSHEVVAVGETVDQRSDILHRGWRRLRDTITGRPNCLHPATLPRVEKLVADLNASRGFDLVFGSLWMAPAFLHARIHRRVLDDQNYEAELSGRLWRREPPGFRKLARFLDWRTIARFERTCLSRADAVTVCSERDQAQLLSHVPDLPPTHIVPNGVDLDSITFSDAPRELDTLVMVGGMSYPPNIEAACFLVREVLPRVWSTRPEVRLVLVGSNPEAAVWSLAGPRVIVTGTVPDVRPYLNRAAVSVVPLFSGGGTHLKILEAMAAGLPVITTPIGAEGLDLRHDEEAVIVESAGAMAGAILELLADRTRAGRLSAAARRRVESTYGWSAIGERFANLLGDLASRDVPSVPQGNPSHRLAS